MHKGNAPVYKKIRPRDKKAQTNLRNVQEKENIVSCPNYKNYSPKKTLDSRQAFQPLQSISNFFLAI